MEYCCKQLRSEARRCSGKRIPRENRGNVAQLQKKYTEKVFKFLKLFAIIKLGFVKNRRNLSGEIPYFG